MEDSIWFVPLMICGGIAFAAFMLFVFVKRLGGWHSLQKAYPLPEGMVIDGDAYSMQSLNTNFLIAYRNMVKVTIMRKGLVLQTGMMEWLLPPVFIPWKEIKHKERKDVFQSRMVFYTERKRFVISGSSVKAIAGFN